MQDEHFMRDWARWQHRSSHKESSPGQTAVKRTRSDQGNCEVIGGPYAEPPIRRGMTQVAHASLRGLAATVMTFALWMTVMVLTTPEGLASPLAAAADCGASPILA